jgi:hypothetical protein
MKVFSTVDGVNWRDDGIAFSPTHNTTWAHNAWAQQVRPSKPQCWVHELLCAHTRPPTHSLTQ